mmetsp:Transcript_24759/g.38547  ORF Transcript_24759/g.38547 Transcript_24759/m.38547 type:complete len:118 (-) Transcript_24759:120-473(-)
MITPNGRFKPSTRICMSMSDYHPETWNPSWNVQTIIIGLISFMQTDERTAGCVVSSDYQKQIFAAQSLEYNLSKQPKFTELFKNYFKLMEIDPANPNKNKKKQEEEVKSLQKKETAL